MMRFFSKKIIPIIVILGMLASFGIPQKTYAQLVAVVDAGNIAQTTVSAAANTTSAASSYSLWIKEYILDNVAYMLAKMVLRELTSSIVNWINTGFEGNPSFVSNPSEFFKDIGDQLLGEMILGNESLAFLCTPFSIDLKLQLAFKYSPFKKRISCTLTDVIANASGAVQNASINGFTAGDFAQGGWPAFVNMTTEPQNNLYGAYIQADFELSARIADMEKRKSDELNQGRGFLSWRKCKNVETGEVDEESGGALVKQVCEVQTPGSVIAGVLDANTTGPLQELHLADEINEVVNALFAQMVKQVLTTGLRGLSGSGPSDPDSYVNQLEQEQAGNNQQLQTLKTQILHDIDAYIRKEENFKVIKNTTLNTNLLVKNKLDAVKACYSTKIQTLNLSAAQISAANERITSIEATIQNRITATSTRLLSDISLSDTNITSLQSIKQRATAAKTVNEVAAPAQEYPTVLGLIHTDKDILDAAAERDQAATGLDVTNRYADLQMNICNLFPGNVQQ